MAKRPAPQRDGRRASTAASPGERKRTAVRDKPVGRTTRDGKRDAKGKRDTRPQRSKPVGSGPQTTPVARPTTARPKTAAAAKARAKARKAKAPKVVRPPLRDRLLARIAEIDLDPRRLVTRVPFVVLIIGALGMGLGVTLWLSTSAAERSYELGRARDVNQALQQQKEMLERDVLEAQAAPALADAARNLGMIPSRDTAHLVQDASGNWTVIGSPKPAQGVPPAPLNTPLPPQAAPAPPPPPPPPAPRVIDPRELMVRQPDPAVVPVPGAPVAGVPVPGAPLAVPPAPDAATAPVVVPPAAVPLQAGPQPYQVAPQAVPVPQALAPGAPIWAPLLAQAAPVVAQPAPVVQPVPAVAPPVPGATA
ncbi:hypothetical protein ABIA30_004939 [Mycobacterium sp. MAA66]|uniref:hypothetical protein n=1 Tax=Mycobacterium sp. MAA66 TaxID=3156297 RepID=UPI003514C07D